MTAGSTGTGRSGNVGVVTVGNGRLGTDSVASVGSGRLGSDAVVIVGSEIGSSGNDALTSGSEIAEWVD